MPIISPSSIDSTLIQDGQAAGSITPLVFRKVVDSLAGAASPTAITASTYTLVLTDRGTVIEFNSSSAQTLLIPTNASVAFDIGTVIGWFQYGVGQLTIAAVSSGTTTLRTASSLTARTRYSSGSIRKRATDEWVVMGDVT
jgi:hypothetical protein